MSNNNGDIYIVGKKSLSDDSIKMKNGLYLNKTKSEKENILDDLECCDCMGDVSKLLRQYGR